MKIFLRLFLFLIFCSAECVNARDSAKDISENYYVGKTVKSNWGGGVLVVKFLEDGKVQGSYNKQGQVWRSAGKYNIDNNGTMCVDWSNRDWKKFCHIFGTGAAKIQ